MAKTYYGYKKRDGLQAVDYLGAAKDLTKGLTDIFDEREKERGLIEEEIREAEKQTKDVPMGDSSSLNEAVLESSSGAAEALRQQTNLMRNGVIKPSEFAKFRQNVMDGMVDLKAGAVALNKNIVDTEAAVAAGTASVAQAKFLEDAMQDTWFDRTRMYTDSKSGHMMIVRVDEKGKDIKGSENSVRNFKNQTKQIIARYDIEKETSSFTKTLGEDIRLSMKSGVKTVKDALSKKTIDPETKKEYTGFDLVKDYVDGASDADLASILVDELGGKYSPTGDVNDKGKKGMVYYEADPTALNKNSRVPKLTPEQKDAAREYLRANIYAQIDYSETAAATTSSRETEAQRKRQSAADAALEETTRLWNLFTGDEAKKAEIMDVYRPSIEALLGKGNYGGYDITDNQIILYQRTKAGLEPRVIDIPSDFKSFVDLASTNFGLSKNLDEMYDKSTSGIKDFDPAAQYKKANVEKRPRVIYKPTKTIEDATDDLDEALDQIAGGLGGYNKTQITAGKIGVDAARGAKSYLTSVGLTGAIVEKGDGNSVKITLDGVTPKSGIIVELTQTRRGAKTDLKTALKAIHDAAGMGQLVTGYPTAEDDDPKPDPNPKPDGGDIDYSSK
jgi:hypothetical protein